MIIKKLKNNDIKICILDCTDDEFMQRGATRKTSSNAYSIGMRCIKTDLIYGGYTKEIPVVEIKNIGFFDICLLSLTAITEIISFLRIIDDKQYIKGRVKIIAGGFGCLNIYSIMDYIDYAVFGRCDDQQIIDILNGIYEKNVWVKSQDENLKNKYFIGQFEGKHKFETGTIGCRMKCYYCQYTYVRKHDKKPYRPQIGASETDIWESDFTKPRVYKTAIDGLSEITRLKVNKKITDKYLFEKFETAYAIANRDKTIVINLYNIILYPFETSASVITDMQHFIEKVKKIDRRTGKYDIRIILQHTPFSPELFTPLEDEDVNPFLSCRQILKMNYIGIDIRLTHTLFLQGPYIRAKRMLINRCTFENRKEIEKLLVMNREEFKQINYETIKQYLNFSKLNYLFLGLQ